MKIKELEFLGDKAMMAFKEDKNRIQLLNAYVHYWRAIGSNPKASIAERIYRKMSKIESIVMDL